MTSKQHSAIGVWAVAALVAAMSACTASVHAQGIWYDKDGTLYDENGEILDAAPDETYFAYADDDADTDQRFADYVQRGQQAMTEGDYDTAVRAFQAALMENDDPEIFEWLQQAIEKAVKPRLAVTDFTVSGPWKLDNPSQDLAEMFLPKLSRERYQLVERSRLTELLKEQDLTIAGLVGDPEKLLDQSLLGIRYLVMGSAIYGEPSVLSARLVDAVTGEIVQTAQVAMDSDRDLLRALDDLAAMIVMTDEEKAAFLLEIQQRLTQDDEEWPVWQEHQEQERYFLETQWRHRQHEAYEWWMKVKTMLADGEYAEASRLARHCMSAYADTSYAAEFGELYEKASRLAAKEAARGRNDRVAMDELARHERLRETERFDFYVDRGQRAMNARDYATAMENFRLALAIRDHRDVRSWLDQCRQSLQKPRLAVVAFGQADGLGMDAVFNGFSTARYAYVTQRQLETYCRSRRITLRPDMAASSLAALADDVQFVVFVNISRSGGFFTVQARMLDLRARRETGTMRYDGIGDRAELQRVLARTGRDLQNPAAAAQYKRDRQQYDRLMDTARNEFARRRWQQALDAYRSAYKLQPTTEAFRGISLCNARLEEERKNRNADAQQQRNQQLYKDAMAKAQTAYKRMDYQEAQRQASIALSFVPRDQAAQRMIDDCRARQAAFKPDNIGQGSRPTPPAKPDQKQPMPPPAKPDQKQPAPPLAKPDQKQPAPPPAKPDQKQPAPPPAKPDQKPEQKPEQEPDSRQPPARPTPPARGR
ncbi:MAG: hypothetical protein FWE88_01705 [Phycisphaerae bacterium]|nr:hypothetical protein [Phycisphaerae bacterium]